MRWSEILDGAPVPAAPIAAPAPRAMPERWTREHLRWNGGRCVPAPEWTDCPSCRGGWLPTPRGPWARCRCQELQDLALRYTQAEIPALYRGVTPGATETGGAISPEFLRKVVGLGRGITAQARGLTLTGNPGTGKTHTAALVAHEAILQGRDVRWVSWHRAAEEARLWPSQRTRAWPPPEWISADLLVLDEVGAQAQLSVREAGELLAVIGARYDHGRRAMMITTNVVQEQLQTALGATLHSRIAEMTYIVPLVGDDRRRR